MNGDFAILLFWFGISLTTNIALGLAWFRTSRRLRQLEGGEGKGRSHRPEQAQLEDLTARVEQSVDSLAARVDELASGQEFLNRVLSDRLDKLGRAAPSSDAHHPARE